MREAARTEPPRADAALGRLAGKAGKTSAECPSRFLGGCVRSRVAEGQARLASLLPDVRHEIATESDGLEEMTVAAAQFSDRDLE